MFKMERDGLTPDIPGEIGPMTQIEEIKSNNLPVTFISGDVLSTGSSRKSATNSVLLVFGDDIPGVPNKRSGGICFGIGRSHHFFQYDGGCWGTSF